MTELIGRRRRRRRRRRGRRTDRARLESVARTFARREQSHGARGHKLINGQ